MPHPRRSHPAQSPRARLVPVYLANYADDSRFTQELETFFEKHRPPLEELARRGVTLAAPYLYGSATVPNASLRLQDTFKAILVFAQQWRLDRLFPEGMDALCEWLCRRTVRGRVRTEYIREGTTVSIRTVIDLRLPCHYDVTGADFARELGGGTSPWLTLPDIETGVDDTPVVRTEAGAVGAFSPEWETPREAKRRMQWRNKGDIPKAVDEIAARYEGEGWVFADTEPELETHLHWLYRRVVYGENPRVIADREPDTKEIYETMVRAATDKRAQQLNINVSQ